LTISTNYTRLIKLLKNISYVSYELPFSQILSYDLTDYLDARSWKCKARRDLKDTGITRDIKE